MPSASLKITSKGQITLKRVVLEHLGLRPGDELQAVLRPGGKVELMAPPAQHDISAVFGMLYRAGQKTLSIEEMDQAIADEVAALDDATKR